MGADNTDLREAIRTLANVDELSIYESTICTVSNINTTTMTCDCSPIDGSADFLDVLLCVNKKNGFVLVPKDGTLVTITQLTESDAFLSMVSEVDSILLNGDTNGGIVKVIDLTTKLNNLENKVNQLIAAIVAWTPVPNDGGAALKALLATWSSTTLTLTVRGDIENTKVKNG